MRKTIYTIAVAVVCMLTSNVNAQDAAAKLSEADASYSSKDLENTRYALQQALMEINKAVGKDILDLLPKTITDLAIVPKDDNVNGAAGFAGLFVNRTYGEGDKNLKIEIISDSPMLAGLNAMLAMPAILGNSNPNEKRMKIAGYKAMLQKSSSDAANVSYTVQIPLNQALFTLHVNGIPAENDVVNIANGLPLDQIAKLAQ
jgi:hypothetical protein